MKHYDPEDEVATPETENGKDPDSDTRSHSDDWENDDEDKDTKKEEE